jgi:CheY-like chemotaxis protein
MSFQNMGGTRLKMVDDSITAMCCSVQKESGIPGNICDRSVEMSDDDQSQTYLPNANSLGANQPIILVADDEVMIRNIVTLLLQAKGYIVLSASDGQEALELSRNYPGAIDLVITDREMPRLNGMDLIAHLLEERPRIKSIVMSGSDISEIVSQNINLQFLPKPFDGEALLARVRTILGAPVPSSKNSEKLRR